MPSHFPGFMVFDGFSYDSCPLFWLIWIASKGLSWRCCLAHRSLYERKKILEVVVSNLNRRPYPHAQIHTILMYTYSPSHMYTMLIHMYASTPTSPHACTYTIVTHTYHTHTFTHVHYIYACIHIHIYTCLHIYTSTHIHDIYRHTHKYALSQFLSCCYSRTSDQNSLGRKGLLDLYFWVTSYHCGKSERKLKQRSRRNTAYGLILWLVLLAFLCRWGPPA